MYFLFFVWKNRTIFSKTTRNSGGLRPLTPVSCGFWVSCVKPHDSVKTTRFAKMSPTHDSCVKTTRKKRYARDDWRLLFSFPVSHALPIVPVPRSVAYTVGASLLNRPPPLFGDMPNKNPQNGRGGKGGGVGGLDIMCYRPG